MSDIKMIIGIEIEGQKLLFSEDAAKKLYEKLKSIFEEKEKITYIPWTYPVITQPIYINPSWWYPVVYSNNMIGSTNITYNTSSSELKVTCYTVT